MLFRPSMARDLEKADCLENACVANSIWAGYLESPANQRFVKCLKERGLPMHFCHTSAHVGIRTFQLVPVHAQVSFVEPPPKSPPKRITSCRCLSYAIPWRIARGEGRGTGLRLNQFVPFQTQVSSK